MSSPPSPIPHPHQNEPTWSKSEKTIARTAFDAALGRELHEAIQEVKRMASVVTAFRVVGRITRDMLWNPISARCLP